MNRHGLKTDASSLLTIALSYTGLGRAASRDPLSALGTIAQSAKGSLAAVRLFTKNRREDLGSVERISDIKEHLNSMIASGDWTTGIGIRFEASLWLTCGEVSFKGMSISREAECVLSLEFGQGSFLVAPEGPYIDDRILELCQVGQAIFKAQDFTVGMLSAEELAPSLFEPRLTALPPTNWVFWCAEVMRRVSRQQLRRFMAEAIEAKELENGGVFWRWSAFGEEPSPERKVVMKTFAQQLRESISDYLSANKVPKYGGPPPILKGSE